MGKRTREPAHEPRWRQWKADEARQVIDAWRASGLPLATFARQRRLSAQRLWWWRKRLRDWGAESEEPPRLVQALVMEPRTTSAAMVTLRMPGGIVVEVADAGAVSTTWLSALMAELVRRAP